MALPEDNKRFIRQVIGADPLDKTIEWIRQWMEPEEIFPSDQLSAWAERNGYEEIKKD